MSFWLSLVIFIFAGFTRAKHTVQLAVEIMKCSPHSLQVCSSYILVNTSALPPQNGQGFNKPSLIVFLSLGVFPCFVFYLFVSVCRCVSLVICVTPNLSFSTLKYVSLSETLYRKTTEQNHILYRSLSLR